MEEREEHIEFFDRYCPYCRTEGRLDIYSARTSAFDTLYRCGLCYKVFDQKDREEQERKNRMKRTVTEAPILEKKPKKKKRKKTMLFIMVLCLTIFIYYLTKR